MLIDWFRGLFNREGKLDLNVICADIKSEIAIRELAVQSCINLIANSVARSEFVTYENGKEVRKNNYYTFNVEPNQNQNSSKFWRDVINKLVYKNECLVIQRKDNFYIADDFQVQKRVFKENIYSNIVIGDLPLYRSYVESEVFHFELHNEKIKNFIDGMYSLYGKLIAYSDSNYKKSNARRGVLKLDMTYSQTLNDREGLEELLNEDFKRFFESEGGAVLPLTKGQEYEDLKPSNYKADSRDIKALIDDVFEFVAIAFQIPPVLLRGSVADTDKAMNNFLTFCINPIAELITDEINRKYYGRENFLKKSYLRMDTTRIKSLDIKDIAGSLDVLFRTGINTINDNLKVMGRETIEDDYANTRFVTKNYQRVEELKGSE